MLIYSQTSISFINRVKQEIRLIINNEIALFYPVSFNRNRISFNKISYPISVVVFEDNARLGYFDSRFYELGFSKKLMFSTTDEVLKNIIRHELAHFISHIIHGPTAAHGKDFKEVCRKMLWDASVEKAYCNLELENDSIEIKNHKTEQLLLKLKKLLALASSDNIHEAKLATIKANALLLEHNLSYLHSEEVQENSFVVKRVLSSQRKNAKHDAIYQILQTFCVSPVLNYGSGIFYLEVTGDHTSVLLADYVANFLDKELDLVWKKAQIENPKLKGLTAKNSFLRGVAKGYVTQIKEEKNKTANPHDLILIEKNLEKLKSIAYPRLNHSGMNIPQNNLAASLLGMEKGRRLSIKPAISSSNGTNFLLT